MRVLYLHNKYQQKGGEDTVFYQEFELMKGHLEAEAIVFQNHGGWKGAMQFLSELWNPVTARTIKQAIDRFRPDIIHVHNWHYGIGPVVFRIAAAKKIPVVATVQNFRLLCPSATLMYNGKMYTRSLKASFPWDAVFKKVYRNSFFQTFWLAFIIWVHRSTGTFKKVTRFILQTEVARQTYLDSSIGLGPEQFTIKPNFIADPAPPVLTRKPHFLFIGRLSQEKGVDVLLKAFAGTNLPLVIGGDGPLLPLVEAAMKTNPNIRYLGLLDKSGVQQQMSECSALLFPSVWYEGMPMTLIESLASSTPVIASNMGAMAAMVQDGVNGLLVNPDDPEDLRRKLNQWSSLSAVEQEQFRTRARQSYENRYTPAINKTLLQDIYQAAIDQHKQKGAF